MPQCGEDGSQENVAFEGFSRVQDSRSHSLGQLTDVLLKADPAPEVLVEHDVKTLAEVLSQGRYIIVGHPLEVCIDNSTGEGWIVGAIEPLSQGPECLKASPEVGVSAKLE